MKRGTRMQVWSLQTGKVMDIAAECIIEPLRVKLQAINFATEDAEMILRIDDVIAADKEKPPAPMFEEY